jgi:hypothetical protein
MHGTAIHPQEWAFSLVSTQTKGELRAIEVLILKFARAHAEKCSQAGYVFHAQIDPTVLRAAARASGLAGETHALDNQPATLKTPVRRTNEIGKPRPLCPPQWNSVGFGSLNYKYPLLYIRRSSCTRRLQKESTARVATTTAGFGSDDFASVGNGDEQETEGV